MLVCQAYKDSEGSNEISLSNARDKKAFQYESLSYHGGDYEKYRNEEPRLLQSAGEFLPDYT